MKSKKNSERKSEEQLAEELKSCRRRVQELEQSLKELREAQQSGGESEERLRLIADNMTDIITLIDQYGAYQYVSPSFKAVMGYSPVQKGKLGFESVHPADMPAVQQVLMNGVVMRSPDTVEFRCRHASGTYLWLESIGKPILDETGKLTGAVFCLRDITDRKKAEELLILSEEKYRNLVENIDEVIYQTDERGIVTYISPSVNGLRGYEPSDIIGRPFIEFICPEDLPRILELYQKLLSGPVPQSEYRLVLKSGELLWVQSSSRAMFDGDRFKGLQGTLRDVTARRQMEEALRESEKKYRLLVENSNDLIYSTDDKGYLTYVNAAVERVVGRSRSEIVGRHFLSFVRPDFHEKISIFYRKQRAENNPNTYFEYPIVTRDGETKWIGQNVQPLLGQSKIIGFQAVARDITERRQAEEALILSEEKYRNLVETINEAIYETDENGIVTFVSTSAGGLRGYELSDIVGRHFTEFVHPIELPRLLAMYQMILSGPIPPTEYRLILKSGEPIWVQASSRAMFEGERFKGLRGTLTDISERKRAEQAQRESETSYRELVEFLPIAVFEVDLQGNVTATNPVIFEMFGYPQDDLKLGLNAFQMIAPQDRDRAMARFRKILEGEKWGGTEYAGRRKDGSTFPIMIYTRRVMRGDATVGARGAIVDLTERKQVEEERKRLEVRLLRAEKMEAVGTLAGGVAHDLNNVLGVLVGYSELLLGDLPEGSPQRHHVANILRSSQRGAAIIQDLLTLARRGVAISEVVNLNQAVSDYLQTPEFEKLKMYHPHVTISAELEKDLLNVKGSPVHLGKTVMNLVSNAAEAIKDGGQITIRTENRYLDRPIRGYDDVKEGDYVVLTVSDNGEGISATDMGNIFEPFYTKKVMGRSGTGLGLAVVWGTVKDHSGYIDVQSTEGKGSSFSLYLPVTRETSARDEKRVPPEQYMGHGESILVVDDVEGQRELAISMFTSLGYEVHAVSSGEEAIEYLKAHAVDLLVLDMIMDPGIDGLETYKRISEIKPRQKAIIVSGFSETDLVKTAQDLGAGSYVQKPYIMEQVGIAIRGELDKK